MRLKIIIIVITVALLVALSVFALKKYLDSSLVDKNGMIRETDSNTEIYVELPSEKE